MRVAINAAVIQDGKLLIVKKRDSWILPGGKPNQGEDEERCLEREVGEELSGTRIKIDRFYNAFQGITPNTGDKLEARVYLCSIEGDLRSPSAEIKESAWMSYHEMHNYKLSDITKKVVIQLRDDNRYTGF